MHKLEGPLSKVDKLALVNTLPVTKGDLHLVLGEREESWDHLLDLIKKFKR